MDHQSRDRPSGRDQQNPGQAPEQIDNLMSSFLVPVHQEGWKFVGITLAAGFLLSWVWSPLWWWSVVLAAAIAYFFRDPPRVTPIREGLVVAPGDGLIAAVKSVRPPMELGLGPEERERISIFLSVLDVHINRSPVSGSIVRSGHVPGMFVNAAKADASEVNERQTTIIKTRDGTEIAVVQIAGLIARRIVPFVAVGDTLSAGQRIGLIRFGSRVDVYLPPGKHGQVALGQIAIGGETVLADLGSSDGSVSPKVHYRRG
jgi:phosphatidylserine decarboxylase